MVEVRLQCTMESTCQYVTVRLVRKYAYQLMERHGVHGQSLEWGNFNVLFDEEPEQDADQVEESRLQPNTDEGGGCHGGHKQMGCHVVVQEGDLFDNVVLL